MKSLNQAPAIELQDQFLERGLPVWECQFFVGKSTHGFFAFRFTFPCERTVVPETMAVRSMDLAERGPIVAVPSATFLMTAATGTCSKRILGRRISMALLTNHPTLPGL